MYGTIFRIQPKPGKEQEVVQIMEEWNREHRPKIRGPVAGCLFKLDNGGMMGVAVFDSKENYVANAENPEQDRWYRRFRELLEADPTWHDGEVIGFW